MESPFFVCEEAQTAAGFHAPAKEQFLGKSFVTSGVFALERGVLVVLADFSGSSAFGRFCGQRALPPPGEVRGRLRVVACLGKSKDLGRFKAGHR